MNQNPIIKALQENLAKERYDLRKEVVKRKYTCSDHDYSLVTLGHEAATARLLTIVEKAVEMAEWFETSYGSAIPGKKAREFLTTLADASGEMNKESK